MTSRTRLIRAGRRPRRTGSGLGVFLATVLTVGGVGMTTVPAIAATDTNPDFMLIEDDLEHILKQIQIAEAHAAGGNLLCSEPTDTSGKCVPDPALPYGLRTVDGSYNNLLHPTWGAADQNFPRLLAPLWRQADAEQPAPPFISANDPADMADCDEGVTCYGQEHGNVYDSEPRVISNLIVDQTTNNPAAVNAANNTPGGVVEEASNEGPGNVYVPNTAPDEALSAPFNAWFTFFGQFFDHGLDLVNKGGNDTLVVPLQPDDPLYNDPRSHGNFLTLTRATQYKDADGNVQHVNQTTPFIDQNQTYTSHPAHQVFLREYELVDGKPHDTGRLLDGTLPSGGTGGLATWADVKRQAREVLGIDLVDDDVLNVPQIVTDPYGNFIPGDSGFPLLVTQDPDTDVARNIEGDPEAPISTSDAMRTNHAFLDDIAHGAVPGGTSFDPALLDDHFVTGDGRGNENIGLTSVHHVFHSEHNRMVNEIDEMLRLPENEELFKAFQGLDNDYEEKLGEELPDGPEADDWTYEQRLFQAARFPTEMQYQHLVFEEFARKVQPAIDPIVLNENSYDATINPAIKAEYAHVVYRFGHSMLTEDIERRLPGRDDVTDVSLLSGFLNPRTYDEQGTLTPDQAAGAIINGTTNQVAGQIDEFVVDTLRNNLLGLPLDLATINLVRARDAGVPSLQAARAKFFAESGDPMLEPYSSWVDFGLSLKNGDNFGRDTELPNASLINFVAAYGQHPTILAQDTVAGKREAARLVVNGPDAPDPSDPNAPPVPEDPALADRLDFMNSTGDWADRETGLNLVDFWVGGLAEALEPFGGMLGSTFNYVFEKEIEDLQFGDRFYYLFRNQGNQLFAALENNSFANLIRRNTDASALPADIFSVPQISVDLEALPDPLPEGLIQMPNGQWRWDGDEHIEIHGLREAPDNIRGAQGDDSLWGYGGNDRIEGGSGNDGILGGPGDDILTDTFGDDNIKGGLGNDAIKAGAGDDLILGSHGRDFVSAGNDFKSVFSGTGDDIVVGGTGRDTVFAGEGSDWIEGGPHADLMQGDNANQFQNNPHGGSDIVDGGPGNDDLEGEGGDDILIGRPQGTDRHEGMHGYDFVTYRGDDTGVDVDLRFTTLQRPDNQAVRDRFDLIEAISGGDGDDVLRGMGNEIDDVPDLDEHKMTQKTLNLIDGLRAMLDPGHVTNYADRFMVQEIGFDTDGSNNLLLGGAGSDMIQSRAGNDFLDGDAYLDVYLMANGERYDNPSEEALQNLVFSGDLNPGDITMHREIAYDTTPDDDKDTAVFGAPRSQYSVTRLGGDYWQVAHDLTDTEPEEAEGSDVIRNFEYLQFDDGCYVLPSLEPCGSYGTASLDYTAPATENEPIGATVVFDGDIEVQNPTDIRFRWKFAEEEDVNGAAEWLAADVQQARNCATNADGFLECSTSYTPGDLVVDNLLRVEVTFLDDDGVMRRIQSPPTTEMVVNVNDEPVVPVLKNQLGQRLDVDEDGDGPLEPPVPQINQVIRASGLQDGDGLEEAGETLQWVWQTSLSRNGPWTTVATNPFTITGFIPTDEHAGLYVRAVATYDDDLGTSEAAASLATVNPLPGEPVNPGGSGDPDPGNPGSGNGNGGPPVTPPGPPVTPPGNGNPGNPGNGNGAPPAQALAIVSSVPAASATEVATRTAVRMVLAGDVQGVGTDTVRLQRAGGKLIPSRVSYDAAAREVKVTPKKGLPADRVVKVVMAGLRNSAGEILPSTTWTFRTKDDVQPRIVKVKPSDKRVKRSADIRLKADESLRHVDRRSVVIREKGGSKVKATVAYRFGKHLIVVDPAKRLDRRTTYVVIVKSRVTDAAGNAIRRTTWTFRTR